MRNPSITTKIVLTAKNLPVFRVGAVAALLLGSPALHAATVGFGGKSMDKKYRAILKAQMAVADPKKHPKFAGNVASTDIRDLWRNSGPNNQGHHYNGNAETYMLVGDSLGRSMLTMINNNQ